jgi:hypothetical protein
MLVELDRLAGVIDADANRSRELPNIGPHVRQIFGHEADVIYLDVGAGWCEIISVDPKSGLFEVILRDIIEASEVEGGV